MLSAKLDTTIVLGSTLPWSTFIGKSFTPPFTPHSGIPTPMMKAGYGLGGVTLAYDRCTTRLMKVVSFVA